MLPLGSLFPNVEMPSSKGGVVNLAEVFAKSPTVIVVVPRHARDAWLRTLSEHVFHWLMERFVNVYLIIDIAPSEARFLADEYGLQPPFLSDAGRFGFYPDAEGVYRVEGGQITATINPAEGPAALARLF